jgi:hypothetical protein
MPFDSIMVLNWLERNSPPPPDYKCLMVDENRFSTNALNFINEINTSALVLSGYNQENQEKSYIKMT